MAEGAVLRIVAPVGGFLGKGSKAEIVDRTLLTTRSVEYDALVFADGTGSLVEPRLGVMVGEMFRHCKVLAAWGDGAAALSAAFIDVAAPGVLVAEKANAAFIADLVAAVGMHRAWDRVALLPAPAAP